MRGPSNLPWPEICSKYQTQVRAKELDYEYDSTNGIVLACQPGRSAQKLWATGLTRNRRLLLFFDSRSGAPFKVIRPARYYESIRGAGAFVGLQP